MSVFSGKTKIAIDQQAISTLIDEGCTIDGNFRASSFARVDGTINGNVTIEEGLILGEKGLIKGQIYTKEMVIYGTINGNVHVKSLQIKSTGKITGDIKTDTIAIETGAVYDGKISMNVDN